MMAKKCDCHGVVEIAGAGSSAEGAAVGAADAVVCAGAGDAVAFGFGSAVR